MFNNRTIKYKSYIYICFSTCTWIVEPVLFLNNITYSRFQWLRVKVSRYMRIARSLFLKQNWLVLNFNIRISYNGKFIISVVKTFSVPVWMFKILPWKLDIQHEIETCWKRLSLIHPKYSTSYRRLHTIVHFSVSPNSQKHNFTNKLNSCCCDSSAA